jgi:hypothetical protein
MPRGVLQKDMIVIFYTFVLGIVLPPIIWAQTASPTNDGSATSTTTLGSVTLFDPMLDGRKEIAKYNVFMDEIFLRMNLAIKAKNLDPMDLKLLPNKMPRLQKATLYDVSKVKAWLHGMSSLKRTGDVSIFFHTDYRTIQCPFALGPLELRVVKTVNGKTKTAKAVTDMMLGMMDMRIDKTQTSGAVITDVYFDEPGGVNVSGNLKKRAHHKKDTPYRLALVSRAAASLKKVARLVVG